MRLADKKYIESTKEGPPTVLCCNCMRKQATWFAPAEKKAEDCKDISHDTVCWLWSNCLYTLGVAW